MGVRLSFAHLCHRFGANEVKLLAQQHTLVSEQNLIMPQTLITKLVGGKETFYNHYLANDRDSHFNNY